MDKKVVAFLLPDCPGYFTELFYRMGLALKAHGATPVFLATTPYYERVKKVDLNKAGPVYYLNEYLQKQQQPSEYQHHAIDNWSNYASYSRQTYFYGKSLNTPQTFKRVKAFFSTVFKENDVKLLISEGVSNSFLYLSHQVATDLNIPYFGYMGARIPYHFNIHTDVTGNEVLVNKEATTYTPTNEIPDYMKNSQFGGLFDKGYSLFSFSFVKELLHIATTPTFRSLEIGNSKTYLYKVYKIAFKRIFYDKYFNKILKIFEPDVKFSKERIFVVYPLHFYPEASTSIFAKYYDGNELNLIKNIAFSLPENATLVVKEHKSNVGNNTKAFYEAIKQLPNTILLSPYFPLKDNLNKFDAVVTLSSTVGFEALTMNVPVYPLGEIFYQNYPGSFKINSYAELDAAMRSITKNTNQKPSDTAYALYSQICYKGSFNYMSPSCMSEANVDLLLKPAIEYLNGSPLVKHRNDKA